MRTIIRYGALIGLAALAACELDVQNPNDPETERVLSTPKEAEALLGSYYKRWHSGMYGSLSNMWGMANVMSFEDYSSLANNCMNARAGIPRPANDNNVSNACSTEQHRVYFYMHEVSRVATTILHAFNQPGYSLGAPGLPETIAQDERAKGFAQFLRGLSNGYLALVYDSASVLLTGQGDVEAGEMSDYRTVMDSAIAQLDAAIAHAQAAEAAGGIEIPDEWIPTNDDLDMPYFEALIRSYRARFRASVARTPAERAAVDWTEVIDDAENGITADHDNITDTNNGPFNTWTSQFHSYGLWHQMPPWIIGMGDTTGSYAAWIAMPLEQRGTGGAFFMRTPDQRFPQGANRAAQQADFSTTASVANGGCNAAATECKRYFVNRPSGNDQSAGLTWGQSNYDFVRYHSWRNRGDEGSARNGRFPFFKRAELDMLAAEGYIRQGDYASAAALINITRTAGMVNGRATGGGLPAVTGTADGGLSGNACVPKRPVNAGTAGGGTLTCGDLMEAMKWEKRLETSQSHFATWFLDSRGWGDLPAGTPTHWAPPYQELQARERGIYSIGTTTPGTGHVAAAGTYGW